ncbi:MAG: MmgE/PrpD family protein [Kibdelosporangium sp.]
MTVTTGQGTAIGYDLLAQAIVAAAARPLPGNVASAACRTLFNVLAVAAGASQSAEVRRLSEHLPEVAGGVLAAPGDNRRVAAWDAALLTGFAAHLDDFDDTHLATVIHPGAACLGAAWAQAGDEFDGAALITAFALGCEVQLRLGVAVSPEHYDRGWHITGTCGVIGATVTAALLSGVDGAELADALRIASVQTLGYREAFGSQLKPLHAGLAAENGCRAADMARSGELSSVRADLPDLAPLLAALAPGGARPVDTDFGGRWELPDNTFKPYPCGIVAHPGIDAAVRAHADLPPEGWQQIESVRYRCHPLVPELMGNPSPQDGLQARFSAIHGAAVGLRYGRAGLDEYTDIAAIDTDLAGLRARITLVPDPALGRDEAELSIELAGRSLRSHVEHARGSLARPLTDADLQDKAAGLLHGDPGPLWRFVAELSGPSQWSDVPIGGKAQ